MKTYIILFISTLFSILVTAQPPAEKWFTIKAFLPGYDKGEVWIEQDGKRLGSGRILNDVFSFNGISAKPSLAVMHIRKPGKVLVFGFFIEAGTINIRAKSAYIINVYGTPLNDAYADFRKQSDSLSKGKTVSEINGIKTSLAADLIRRNPASLLSIQLLKEYFYLNQQVNDSLYHSLFNTIDPSLRTGVDGKKIGEEVNLRMRTTIGVPAPVVVLKDTTGVQHAIRTNAKITIIHFWASWCFPCRAELVALKKLAGSDTSLNVVMVSLDENPAAWKSGIRKDNTDWLQLSDLKGWKGNAATVYGITTLPDNYLLDEAGNILGRHLSVPQIEAILQMHGKKR